MQRWNPDRLDWLSAARLLRDLIYKEDEATELHAVLPSLDPAPAKPPAGELALLGQNRNDLARALVAESNGTYTSVKILSHISKRKLAHMLYEVRGAATAQGRRA